MVSASAMSMCKTALRLTLDSGSANNYIADSADLVLTASASATLNFTGTDTVRALSLDGGATYKVASTYGLARFDCAT